MKRRGLEYLKEWYSRKRRKPLVIRGARQVGKSYLVRMFAAENNLELIEINFEKYPEYGEIFESKDPQTIVSLLELKLQTTITTKQTLVFFDEIQAAPKTFAALRFFYEEMPSLAIICAGSLLEFTLKEHTFSMPVGRIEYFYLGPLTFEEFLEATGKSKSVEFLKTYTLDKNLHQAIHNQLISDF